MRSAFLFSAIVGLAAIPGAAFANSHGRPCTDKPESERLSLEPLKAKVAEQGYPIRSGEIRKPCGEFYVLDKNNQRAELFVDPVTGKVIAGDGKGETGMSRGDNRTAMSGAGKERDGDDKDGDDQ